VEILLALLFNPLIWFIVAIVVAVRYSRRKSQSQAGPNHVAGEKYVVDEFGALRLEDMASRVKSAGEKDVLMRAAQSLRHGMMDLLGRSPQQPAPPRPVSQVAPQQVRQPAPEVLPQPAVAAAPSEPLAERGLKALQNINILLYLGAFFLIVAAGVFVGSTYGSISDTAKVLLLATFAGTFYFTGLALYRYTDKIKPAGVTFTAIGLLVAPLVGVAAQTLLYPGQNPGPVWLVTSAVLLVMQVVAFALIRKSYVAYYAALTTISLFQAVTATASAAVYWYGWAMLGTAMVYAVYAKFAKNRDFGEPFAVVAQIFVPIALLVSLLGVQQFGGWHVGIQIVLSSLFYFLCAVLKNFDQSDEEVAYIGIAAALFPLGISIVLGSRGVPRVFVALILLGIGAAYVLAEKLAPEQRHKPVYAALAAILMSVMPMVAIGAASARTVAWLVVAGTVGHAGHYLVTRYRPSFSLMQLGVLILPALVGFLILPEPLSLERIGVLYLVSAAVLVAVTELVLKGRTNEMCDEQLGWAMGAMMLAATAGLISAKFDWLTFILLGITMLLLVLTFLNSTQLFLGAALVGYLACVSLAVWLDVSSLVFSLIFVAWAIGLYGLYRDVPRLRNQPLIAAVSYGSGLLIAYVAAASTSGLAGTLVMALISALIVGISFVERRPEVVVAATGASYGAAIHLAGVQDWPVAIVLFVWSLVLYGLGSAAEDRRLQLVRWSALGGFGLALLTSFDSGLNKWLAVLIHFTAGGAAFAESFRENSRAGKYIASAILWSATLRTYAAADIDFAQLYIQTTAAYFAALAYRQYQNGHRQAQDGLTVAALVTATVPLAVQALDDKTGGYTLGILGLGAALTLFGMSAHYKLVRTWGIATLVIIALYKTAGVIFGWPAWVWLGIIGAGALVGAIYLLGRRPGQEHQEKPAPPQKKV